MQISWNLLHHFCLLGSTNTGKLKVLETWGFEDQDLHKSLSDFQEHMNEGVFLKWIWIHIVRVRASSAAIVWEISQIFTLSKIITVEWVPPPSTPPNTTVSPILTPPPKIWFYILPQNFVSSTPVDIKDGLIWAKVCLRLVLLWRRFESDWRDCGLDTVATATLLLPRASWGYAGKVGHKNLRPLDEEGSPLSRWTNFTVNWWHRT